MNINKELKIFEEKVKEIFFYSSRYGVYTMFKGKKDPLNGFDTKQLNRHCFDGFKIAQAKIVDELKVLQIKSKQCQTDIKQAKRERNKDKENIVIDEFNILNYQSQIFRNLADTIAWQILNGNHYFLRRLYTYETGEKGLLDKSFDHVIKFSEKINANPDAFCLISDLTNNIQLGDCLIVDEEGIKICEVKSGKTNFEALNIITANNLTEEGFDEKKFKEDFDDKFVKQLKRMLSQSAKTERASKIIQNNIGNDPKYKDIRVYISESDIDIKTYHSSLIKLIKQLDERDWAYDCIEAIVHVGAYKNDWRLHGVVTMKTICDPFPFFDLMTSRTAVVCEPVFLKPLENDKIIDIVLGKIKIYIGVDVEKFIEFSNSLGIKASWSTSKELHHYLDNCKGISKEIYTFKNKGIKVEINGQKLFLGRGFFSKIVFDHILPSTMLLKYQSSITNTDFENLS